MARRRRPRSPAEREEALGMWRTLAIIVVAVVLCAALLVLFVEIAR